jgi:PAS domain S-box-containing protein
LRPAEDPLHLAEVVRSAHDAVLSKDLEGIVTSWNPAAERLYGYTEAEAVGRHISFLVPDDHRGEEMEIIARIRSGERVLTYETERIRKDGVRIDVSLTISPLEHPERGIFGASVIARDITQEMRRRRAQEFLVAATRGLEESLDFERTARNIVATAVPEIAEFCVIDFVRPDGWIGDSIVGARDPAAAQVLEGIRRRHPLDPAGKHPVAQVLRAGGPMIWRDLMRPEVMADVVQNEEHRRLIEETRYQSAAVAPLIARNATIGAISFLHANSDLRYEAADLALLGELADRAALALDNARLYEERGRIAANLQRGLRPPEPPYVEGLDIAVTFDAFGEGMEIGGDVYDVLPTDDGCWVMIGDVAGKGGEAAGVSVALRHSLRGLARQIDRPRELLEQLNELLLERSSLNDFATALLLRLRRDGANWSFELAAAGHPPAVHVTAPGTRQLGGGALLGAWAGARARLYESELFPGETLVLTTDGWFETGPPDQHVSPGALATLAHSLAKHDLAAMTEAIRRDAIDRSHGKLRDDMVVLALRPDGAR